MQHPIWLIIQREFLRRVRTKWFILTTLMAPVILMVLFTLPTVTTLWSTSTSPAQTVAVVDKTGVLFPLLRGRLGASHKYQLHQSHQKRQTLRHQVLNNQLDAYLYLPSQLLEGTKEATYYSKGGGGLMQQPKLEAVLANALREYQVQENQVPDSVQAIFSAQAQVSMMQVTPEGDQANHSLLSVIAGYLVGFVLYFMMLLYGIQVMRGVMEEKTTRVVEVIISSVRPFQLMMGKILGIGAVGVLQVLIWIVLISVVLTFAGLFVLPFIEARPLQLQGLELIQPANQEIILQTAGLPVPNVPASLYIYFILFFIGGYLLYSSCYAALGSTIDQESDAQTLQLPILLVLITPMLFVNYVVAYPNTTLSVLLSLLPFFSPVLMMARLSAVVVPTWQTVTALLLLAGSFWGLVWAAGRIYRVGILRYGKHTTLKDLGRWLRST